MLDASECPPTFGVTENTVVGLIAGGHQALAQAHGHAKTAIVMLLLDVPCTEAADLLRKAGGRVRDAIA
jgi:N-acetylmuramic acid 6-phosphate (MurNAc-6-P) etherase